MATLARGSVLGLHPENPFRFMGRRMRESTQLFIDALRHLENTGEVDQIVELFSEGADISSPIAKHSGEGAAGAQKFWASYRTAFQSITSEFRNVVEGDGITMLEWVSVGTTQAGSVRYGGVSVLEFAGDRLTAFRSYFDPAHVAPTTRADPNPLTQAQEKAAGQRQEGGYQ